MTHVPCMKPVWRRVGLAASPLLLGLLLVVHVSGCDYSFGATFDDSTQSILKKPEILSVVLDPPEVAPGGSVRASFLAIDEYGPLELPMQLWMLIDSIDTLRPASGDAEEGPLPDGAQLDPESMGFFPVFDFRARPQEHYRFDKNQQAAQLVTLVAAFTPLDIDALMGDESGAALGELLENRDIALALRTLVVSTSDTPNRNPEIGIITARVGETGSPQPLVLVRSDSETIARDRLNAALNPYVYSVCVSKATRIPPVETCPKEKLYFNISDIQDDGPDSALRVQWVSIAGDFEGRRDRDQRWNIPCYQDLPVIPAEDIDPASPETFKPRRDPNLYPVFLIVRDNGEEGQLGQSWAEFYVRLVMDEDC